MSNQRQLFDFDGSAAHAADLELKKATAGRDRGIEQADAAARPDWKDAAYAAVCEAARRLNSFTVDDVYQFIPAGTPPTHDGRAMGAVMGRAKREGVIRPTSSFRTGKQAKSHANPRRVWVPANKSI